MLAEIISSIKGQACTGGTATTACTGSEDKVLSRLEAARIIDAELHPFESVDVDWTGRLQK